jgi:hypothetical protein
MQKPPHRILVRVLVALGGLLAVLAIFAVWAERQVLNTDDWVETSSELLDDDEIQAALQTFLVDQLFANVDVQARLEDRLPPRVQVLAGPATGALQQFANEVAARALDSPRFQGAWAQANRAAHELLLNLVEGDGELVEAQGGAVTLDLEALVTDLAARVGISEEVADRLPEDVAQLEILQSDQIEAAQTIAAAVRGLAIVFTVAAFGSLGLAIYLARGRRTVTVLWAGIALILAGVVVYALRDAAGQAIVDALIVNEAARPAAESTWSISTSLLTSIATTVIVFGALFVIASWLGSSTDSAVAVRRALAPALRDHPGWAYGLLALGLLIYFALAPTHGLRAILTLLVLGAIAAAGLTALRRQAAEEFPDAQSGDTVARMRGWIGSRGGRPPAPRAGDDDRLARLERLARLRDQGVLTEEEAAAEKARILAPPV